METLTIAYATDENYAKLVWCSLKSLLENNANFFTVKAYIISNVLINLLNRHNTFNMRMRVIVH